MLSRHYLHELNMESGCRYNAKKEFGLMLLFTFAILLFGILWWHYMQKNNFTKRNGVSYTTPAYSTHQKLVSKSIGFRDTDDFRILCS